MKRKTAAFILTSFLAVCILTVPAYAGTVRIRGVSLDIRAEFEPGDVMGDESVKILGLSEEKYEVIEYEILNEGFQWEASSVPELAIRLNSNGDYKFSYIGAKNVHVKGTAFEFVSSKREEKDTVLVLNLRLKPLYSKIQPVEWARLNADGFAEWEESESAGSYELIFQKDGKRAGKSISVTKERTDVLEYVDGPGVYTFKIRPVSRFDSKYKAVWMEAEGIVLDEEAIEKIRSNRELTEDSAKEAPGS